MEETKTVLLLEDEDWVREEVTSQLYKKLDCIIAPVATVKEAKKILLEHKFDLIVLDSCADEGWVTKSQIMPTFKAQELNRNVPVILLAPQPKFSLKEAGVTYSDPKIIGEPGISGYGVGLLRARAIEKTEGERKSKLKVEAIMKAIEIINSKERCTFRQN